MNNELKHYGVPGMKWGVRRSSKELGRARTVAKLKNPANIASTGKAASNAFREGSNIASTVARNSRPSKKVRKDISQMSDQELRARINRLNMEQQYADLNPSRVARGASCAANILAVAGGVAAIGASVATIAMAFKK